MDIFIIRNMESEQKVQKVMKIPSVLSDTLELEIFEWFKDLKILQNEWSLYSVSDVRWLDGW